MGSYLSSCCRRRKPPSEREPLLPKATPPPPARSLADKAVDTITALQSGKYPSQDQLNLILRSIANSRLLQCDVGLASGPGPLSANGRRVLTDVREVVQAVLQVGMEKNADDRLQDLLYQCSQTKGPPVRVDADPAIEAGQEGLSQLNAQAPTYKEVLDDTTKLMQSLKAITRLLLTSAAFRLLLSDIFASAREFLAQAAANVGNVALQVQAAAEDIERAANMNDGSLGVLAEKVGEAAGGILDTVEQPVNQSAAQESTKDVVIAKIQELIVRAHRDPATLSALQTLLFVVRKYSGKLTRSANIISDAQASASTDAHGPAITVTPKDEISQAFEDLQILLERLASGHSLDPLLHSLSEAANSVASQSTSSGSEPTSEPDSDLYLFLYSVDRWLDHALTPTQPAQSLYATSRAGTRALENLYDGGHILFLSSSAFPTAASWTHHLQALFADYDAYIGALGQDRSTMRLVRALGTLQATTADFAALSVVAGGRRWRDEVVRDVLGWVVPRVVGVVGRMGVPMPRVEFQNEMIDGALDALLLGGDGAVSVEVVPDSVVLRTWNELRVDMEAPALSLFSGSSDAIETRTASSSRVQLHIEGIRLSMRDLGYYFKYKGGLVNYSDQGLLSVEVGAPSHLPSSTSGTHDARTPQGLSIDIDVALDPKSQPGYPLHFTNSAGSNEPRLFTVGDVQASFSGLNFEINKSRHWILNTLFVRPLAAPVVSRLAKGVLEQKVKDALENLSIALGMIREEAAQKSRRDRPQQEANPMFSDYWEAVLEVGPSALGFSPAEAEEVAEEENSIETHARTEATLKGIVYTTTTTVVQPGEADSSQPSQQEGGQEQRESSVAIGVGAQLFPDKAGAYDEADEEPILEQAIQGVVDMAVEVEEVAEDVVEGAVNLRREIEDAEERREEVKKAESRRGGWRSRAFDL